MNKIKTTLAAAALTLSAAALVGCSGTGQEPSPASSEDRETLDIAVITHSPAGDQFWDLVKSGATQAGEDLDLDIAYQGDSDPVKQSQFVDAAIADQVDGIVLSLANPDGLKAAMQRAGEAGIPIVAINAGSDVAIAQGALAFVGQDPVVAAEAAGERLLEAGASNISCVIQEAGNVYLETTCTELAKTPGLTVKNLQVDGTNLPDVQATITSQLLSDASIDAVYTINTDIGKAAADAVAESGSEALVTAYNLNEDMLRLIADGKVLFTVDQQGYLQGYQAAQVLDTSIRYGNVLGGGHPVATGPSFVTSGNVAEVESFVKQGTR